MGYLLEERPYIPSKSQEIDQYKNCQKALNEIAEKHLLSNAKDSLDNGNFTRSDSKTSYNSSKKENIVIGLTALGTSATIIGVGVSIYVYNKTKDNNNKIGGLKMKLNHNHYHITQSGLVNINKPTPILSRTLFRL